MGWFIGLMSGTSLDGVDGVVARFDGGIRVAAHSHSPFEAALRDVLLALNRRGDDELHRAALAANALAELYAATTTDLLREAALAPQDVSAIGAHGQTVRHRPGEFDGTGYTLQLLNGALLAERSRIDVVCDLRSRDVAAGGQGAPLVPAFHARCFARPGEDVAVLNLGGIANLSLLPAAGEVTGFDCGPANALLDLWCRQHRAAAFDAGGAWAASGTVHTPLLQGMLAEPFFDRPPPKSTGRDLFNEAWLQQRLAALPAVAAAADVQATLAELTVRSVTAALLQHAPRTSRLVVCGGGAFNAHLMARLAALLPGVRVVPSADEGVPPEQVEALAFAWLAHQHVRGLPGNLQAVTGARGARVLGARYPAG
jgi:anhydro-N-acetylmuramic acid kinase